MNKEKVMIGWADQGFVHGAFTLSMLQMFEFEQKQPNSYELLTPYRVIGPYVQESRNALVRSALEANADWLLQLDGDESFDSHILRMLMNTAIDKNAKIITGLYSNVQEISNGSIKIVNCIYMEAENGFYISVEPPKTMVPFKIHAAGAGILLVHRSVFEAIGDPYFWIELIKNTDGETRMIGEDISFCRRSREAGFDIWCNPLVEAMHWKTLPLLPSSVRDFIEKSEKTFSEIKK